MVVRGQPMGAERPVAHTFSYFTCKRRDQQTWPPGSSPRDPMGKGSDNTPQFDMWDKCSWGKTNAAATNPLAVANLRR